INVAALCRFTVKRDGFHCVRLDSLSPIVGQGKIVQSNRVIKFRCTFIPRYCRPFVLFHAKTAVVAVAHKVHAVDVSSRGRFHQQRKRLTVVLSTTDAIEQILTDFGRFCLRRFDLLHGVCPPSWSLLAFTSRGGGCRAAYAIANSPTSRTDGG